MKNKTNLLLIVLLFIISSCKSEYFIPDNIKDSFFIDCYNVNDTIVFDFEKNGNKIDTLSFIVKENMIENNEDIDYMFDDTTDWESYTFISQSNDTKNSIRFDYSSSDNLFSSKIVLDDLTFSLDIIEKKIDSIQINNVTYKDVFLLTSEHYLNTYSYTSKDKGIIEIVADSIKLISGNKQ